MPHPAVFLDRDGTMNEEAGYADRLERIVLFPWTIEAVRLLRRAGYLVAVTTNQAGVAKGYFGEDFVHEARAHLERQLADGGTKIDGFYYCPHLADGVVEPYRRACDCRKPRPGMALQAARELDIDLRRSVVIGDRWRDVEFGRNAGTRAILVETGYGATEAAHPPGHVLADAVCRDLMEAVVWLLNHPAGE